MPKTETSVTHTRLSASLLSKLPANSSFEFYGSRLTVHLQCERKTEYTEIRLFKTVDITHWVEIVGGGREGGVMHSAQMQAWLQNLLACGELIGFRLADENANTILEIGRV